MVELSITVTQGEGVLRALRNAPELAKRHFGPAADRSAIQVQASAKANAPAHSRTLARSIAVEKIDALSRRVGTDVVYAAIHEFGGEIHALNGEYLHFQIDGQWVMTPEVTIPAQPFMGPALEENRGYIEEQFLAAGEALLAEIAGS